ncbi:hypothetical protein F0365_09105 [Nonlabens sp. Ci31]|uniref:hypothetical protein n=1 Tax=Nonlabens sp. Ci31 TaxID=2608253 RepID=UPI00146315E9|nr:hypothetical protein [Nonlabens sp. Ci31]QJP34543.1 hypothetical protein F0365_09105 [Nonlabens sp. Ci31]
MQETIKNRIPIHIDLAPNRDKLYSGIGLKSNDEIFIFVCFNDETNEFEGYAIVRNYEIDKYREWDEEELGEIENDNSDDLINELRLEKMNNMLECLSELKSDKLIAIYTESDDKSYYVGKIENLTEKKVELKLLDEDAEWIENKIINIKEITYIGFRSNYERELADKNVLQSSRRL